MFKSLFSLFILVLVLGGLGYFLLAYQVVRTEDGYSVIEKKDWEFTAPVLDVRDWDLADFARNLDVSEALAKIKWEKLKSKAEQHWQDFSQRMESMSEDFDFDKASQNLQKRLKDVKGEARQKYDQLVEKWEKDEINMDQFQERVDQLGRWTKQKLEELKAQVPQP